MASLDVDVLKQGLVTYFNLPEMKAKYDAIVGDGFQLSDLSKGVALAILAVDRVEQMVADAGEVGKGGIKHEAVVKWADDCIKLPIWAEPFDDNVISMAVNAICTVRNVMFGNDWVKKIKIFL